MNGIRRLMTEYNEGFLNKMNYDVEAYEAAVNKWYEELKDIVTNDLLRQHINKYPVKSDYEIEEEDDKDCDSNERHTVDN
jgi:hypothetical protein